MLHTEPSKQAFNQSDGLYLNFIFRFLFSSSRIPSFLNKIILKHLIYQFLFGASVFFQLSVGQRKTLHCSLERVQRIFASSFFAILNEFIESSVVSHFHFFSVLFAFSGSICQFLFFSTFHSFRFALLSLLTSFLSKIRCCYSN